MSERIVFLCPHGAAKSVIAAAYCQQLGDRQNVPLRATAAGTEPDAEVSPAVLELLRMEGIDVADQRPRRVTHEELVAAARIILYRWGVTWAIFKLLIRLLSTGMTCRHQARTCSWHVIRSAPTLSSWLRRYGALRCLRLARSKKQVDDHHG